MSDPADRQQIERFIREQIDSVPELEALLLMWRQSPRQWTCEEMSRELYVQIDVARYVMNCLVQLGLAAESLDTAGCFTLSLETPEKRQIVEGLEALYRTNLIYVTNLIHSNASPGLRDFARAFRFKRK